MKKFKTRISDAWNAATDFDKGFFTGIIFYVIFENALRIVWTPIVSNFGGK